MAKLLEFGPGDSDRFELMTDAFFGVEGMPRNSHVAAKIIAKIEEISDQRYKVEDLAPDILVSFQRKMQALALRVLKATGGMLILDDREYEYLKGAVDAADWKHYAVKEGLALAAWIADAKTVKVEKRGGKLELVDG